MAEISELVRWIIVYSVTGGFWHFVACYLVLVVLMRVFAFVRVKVEAPKAPKAEKRED